MSTTESLASRAEDLLIKLNHVMADRQNADAWSRIETTRARALQSREALESALATLPQLDSFGVTRPKLPESRIKQMANARRILRSTATNAAVVETAEMASRISSDSVNRSLSSAEDTGRWLLTQLNRAVENRRVELQPENIEEQVVSYPGVPYSVILGLRRVQTVLQTPVSGIAVAEELVKRMKEIRDGVDYWRTNRPLLDEAQQHQHEDIQRFLEQAASEDGAPWEAITDVVRDFLSNEDNADAIRIRLRS